MLRKKLFNAPSLAAVSFAITFAFVTRPLVAQPKITGVTKNFVRSGSKITISGSGLENVDGGYFGEGTPGSNTNPLFNAANARSNSVQLVTTAACNQEGLLMIHRSTDPAGTQLFGADPPIKVGCVPDTPSGYVQGTENGKVLYVKPSSKIFIKGTYLRAVTSIGDAIAGGNAKTEYPFTYSAINGDETLTVTLPDTKPSNYAFNLDDVVNPAVHGRVNGSVRVGPAPNPSGINPTWSEAGGNLVTVDGHGLSTGTAPTVTVGGVRAQVTKFTELSVTFRLGAETREGPIAIQTDGGTTQVTGEFKVSDGTTRTGGLIVVSGPSSVEQVTVAGDTLVVRGRNLARLNGICVFPPNTGNVYRPLYRLGSPFLVSSNTEMKVRLTADPSQFTSVPVQLYAPPNAGGDYGSHTFACTPNPGNVQWP